MVSRSNKSQGVVKSIYVIGGKEKFLLDMECERLVNSLLDENERAMSLYTLRGNEAEAADVFDELRTAPFLSSRRVVVIKEADKFISENREVLEKYFENPSGTGVFVLVVQTWRKNTKLAKKLLKVGDFIEVGEIKRWDLPKYAVNYAKSEFGKGMNVSAAGLLVELAGDEAGAVCREVEKLAVYVGDRKTIKSDDVEALTGHNRTFGAFAVIDAVMTGNTGEAIGRLRLVRSPFMSDVCSMRRFCLAEG
jgi:DNA polymerase-3 subunit delta